MMFMGRGETGVRSSYTCGTFRVHLGLGQLRLVSTLTGSGRGGMVIESFGVEWFLIMVRWCGRSIGLVFGFERSRIGYRYQCFVFVFQIQILLYWMSTTPNRVKHWCSVGFSRLLIQQLRDLSPTSSTWLCEVGWGGCGEL
jgi:hypothetical protein